MITSRTLSTCVLVAASISTTSMSRPCAISTQASHSPHGSAVGPLMQFSARARILAVVVLPTPRGPENTNDCAMRLAGDRVAQRLRDPALPDDVIEPLRPPFARENLVTMLKAEVSRKSGAIVELFLLPVLLSSALQTQLQQLRARPRPGRPAAHVSDYLALLPSGPDAVRRLRLHRFRAAVRPSTMVNTQWSIGNRQ